MFDVEHGLSRILGRAITRDDHEISSELYQTLRIAHTVLIEDENPAFSKDFPT